MKLFQFKYSPYACKVAIAMDLMGLKYERVEVSYSDRTELAGVTGGYIYVPVLVTDEGKAITESRTICEYLAAMPQGAKLVPAPWQAAIWGFADYADQVLEDVMFRIASPSVRDQWKSPGDRALYVLIKERKFGAGCVDAWLRDRDTLIARAKHLLAPVFQTLEHQPFLFGRAPTLADAALYGNLKMLEEADPQLLARIGAPLVAFMRKIEQETNVSQS